MRARLATPDAPNLAAERCASIGAVAGPAAEVEVDEALVRALEAIGRRAIAAALDEPRALS